MPGYGTAKYGTCKYGSLFGGPQAYSKVLADSFSLGDSFSRIWTAAKSLSDSLALADVCYKALPGISFADAIALADVMIGCRTGASPMTFQPSTIDSYMNQNSPDTNYGSATTMAVQSYENSFLLSYQNDRSILRFDFSSLPANATITSATLSLYYWNCSRDNPTGRTYWAYRLTQTAWTEAGVTWNKYNGTNAWTNPGGDFTTTGGASATVPANPGAWMSWDVITLIQWFQANASSIANLIIKDGTENSSTQYEAVFYTREYATDTTLRPKLVIAYTVPNAFSLVPGPESISLSDSGIRTPGKDFSDSISLTDVFSKIWTALITITDSISLSDIISKNPSKPFSDSITLADVITTYLGILISLSDSFSLSDSIVNTPGKVFSDSMSLSDVLTKALNISKSDSIALSDEISKAISKAITDSITLTDLFSRTVSFIRSLSDSITLDDQISKQISISKSDALDLSDAVVKTFGLSKADSISLSDAITKIFSKALSDQISLTDLISKMPKLTFSDNISLSDEIALSIILIIPMLPKQFLHALINRAEELKSGGIQSQSVKKEEKQQSGDFATGKATLKESLQSGSLLNKPEKKGN